ncbi:MAG: hypothetical protein NCA08_05630 [Deltaproteobacteria bacterium]|nr:hypothetical protein [Candidatus Deferrimicrobium borealis]
MSKFKVYVALLCSWLIAGIPLVSMADGIPSPPSSLKVGAPATGITPTPPPPTPIGRDSMLPGMAPNNYKIPSGWMLVRSQDFEGTKPTGETWNQWNADVRTDRAHTGSKSLGGTYASDQADVAWRFSSGEVGSFTEIYLSFYEYIESQALFNDELFLARFAVDNPFQEVILDWFWAPRFNSPTATLFAVSQGVHYGRFAEKTTTVPKGTWVQWEIHYRPNTSGNSDGFYRVYKDGTLYTSAENVNLNGTRSMENMSIDVGGAYTKLVWMTDHPTCSKCSPGPGEGTDYCTSSNDWWGQKFSSPRCAPTDPPLPSFKRYFDDIILLKK